MNLNQNISTRDSRANFLKSFRPTKVKTEIEREDGELGDEDNNIIASERKDLFLDKSQKSLDPPPPLTAVDSWVTIKLMLEQKAKEEEKLKQQILDKQCQVSNLEAELLQVRNLKKKEDSKQAELQQKLKNLQMKQEDDNKRRSETDERITKLEASLKQEKDKSQERINLLEEDLERVTSRCKRRDAWNEELLLENETLKKRLKTIAGCLND